MTPLDLRALELRAAAARTVIRKTPALDELERSAMLARVVWPDEELLAASLEMARRELRQ